MSRENKKRLLVVIVMLGVGLGFGFGRWLQRPRPLNVTTVRASVEPVPGPPAKAPALAAKAAAAPAIAPAPDALGDDDTDNPLAEAPKEQWHPRPADEWQGMLVDVSMPQYCETSALCGLALACDKDHRCGPCRFDPDCSNGEACVLDRCVPQKNVGCRSRADCASLGPEALCVMNGLTGNEPRANSQLKSFCQAPVGGEVQTPESNLERRAVQLETAGQQYWSEVSPTELEKRLEHALSNQLPSTQKQPAL